MTGWIPQRNKGWLDGYKQPKKQESGESVAVAPPEEKKAYFVLPRCPFCHSKNVKCHTSTLPIRYYKCRDCGKNFKAVEKDA